MTFKKWKEGKEADMVNCCVLNEPDDSPYLDYLGKVGDLPSKFDNYEVINPTQCPPKTSGLVNAQICWLIDLAFVL